MNFGVVIRVVCCERSILAVSVISEPSGLGGRCGRPGLNFSAFQYESRGISEFGVFHSDGDFREAHGRALDGAVKDAIGHALGAQGFVALFSEHPEMASTTLDLPQPLGPTMQVVPEPLKVTMVRSQNDLANDFDFPKLKQGFLFVSLNAYKTLASNSPFQTVVAHGGTISAMRDESLFPGRKAGVATKTLAGSR